MLGKDNLVILKRNFKFDHLSNIKSKSFVSANWLENGMEGRMDSHLTVTLSIEFIALCGGLN